MFAVTLMSPADFFGLSEYKSYLLVFVFSLKMLMQLPMHFNGSIDVV